jgi:hypothetical protein
MLAAGDEVREHSGGQCRTGVRETGSSVEGGPRQAAVTGTEELAAVTHQRGQDGGGRDAREDSFYSCAAWEGDGSSQCGAQR